MVIICWLFLFHFFVVVRSRCPEIAEGGEYKQKSATQTPSGHLSTTSEAEITCKPSTTSMATNSGVQPTNSKTIKKTDEHDLYPNHSKVNVTL